MKKLFLLVLFLPLSNAVAQIPFTRSDSLRGMLTSLRTCFDVTYYHLDISIDPEERQIRGSNLIRFSVVSEFDEMQIDLFDNLTIDRIEFDDGSFLAFRREFNAVVISMPYRLPVASDHEIRVYYGGEPKLADRPPWSGGFIWAKDEEGNPWVAVSCQGIGASLWWPNKDHQSDEPDSMMISITVPPGLMDVSNGRLRGVRPARDGRQRYDWFVTNPINNYNVTVNVGNFARFSEVYPATDGELTLDYYVLPYNESKAREQFRQVGPMLEIFERLFGPYPFREDGFKLVESPYLGMEHQSAIAYGNGYMNGYAGTAQSAVGPSSAIGLEFDFIIIHETAHEWWGNSVTASDVADMWIHESFAAYAEALYVESRWGVETALDYINAKKGSILNDRPIIGQYNVQNAGSKDMYNKGQAVLNTLRSVIDDDSLWFSVVRGLHETFRHRTVSADDVFGYINDRTGKDLTYFFDQYFRTPSVPVFDAYVSRKGDEVLLEYRWIAEPGFRMPVRIMTEENEWTVVTPTTEAETISLGRVDPRRFRVDEDRFYVDTKLSWVYLDKRKEGMSYLRRELR